MIWITNESSKQSIINIFLDLFQFPEKIFAQFRLHLNGSLVNYALAVKKKSWRRGDGSSYNFFLYTKAFS